MPARPKPIDKATLIHCGKLGLSMKHTAALCGLSTSQLRARMASNSELRQAYNHGAANQAQEMVELAVDALRRIIAAGDSKATTAVIHALKHYGGQHEKAAILHAGATEGQAPAGMGPASLQRAAEALGITLPGVDPGADTEPPAAPDD